MIPSSLTKARNFLSTRSEIGIQRFLSWFPFFVCSLLVLGAIDACHGMEPRPKLAQHQDLRAIFSYVNGNIPWNHGPPLQINCRWAHLERLIHRLKFDHGRVPILGLLAELAAHGETSCMEEFVMSPDFPQVQAERNLAIDAALSYEANSSFCRASLIDFLIDRGANPNRDSVAPQYPPLLEAVGNGDYSCSRALLRAGARVRGPGSGRHVGGLLLYTQLTTGMHHKRNQSRITALLLHAGANPNVKGPRGVTAIFLAVSVLPLPGQSCLRCVRLLLQAGANPNVINKRGQTPLLWGLQQKTRVPLETIKVLVEGGAHVNQANPRTGETPLMAAARLGNIKVVDYLLGHGARRCTRDKRGWTAADYALGSEVGSLAAPLACPRHAISREK